MDGIVEAKKAAPTRDEPKRLQFFLDWTQNWTQLRNLLRSPPLLSRCYLNRPGRNRTCNPRFWRPVLYQLSYGPKNWTGRRVGDHHASRPRTLLVRSHALHLAAATRLAVYPSRCQGG